MPGRRPPVVISPAKFRSERFDFPLRRFSVHRSNPAAPPLGAAPLLREDLSMRIHPSVTLERVTEAVERHHTTLDNPCKSPRRACGTMSGSGTGGNLRNPGASEPVTQLRIPPVSASNSPNSHQGRVATLLPQGRAKMEGSAEVFVGIDVAKAKLDVHVHPLGTRFE